MTNRRINPRKPVDFVLNVFQDGLPSLGVAADLSEGGMRLRRLQTPRATNSNAVDLEFVLPASGEVIQVRGAVREERGSHVRVTFDGIDASARETIKAFVAAA